MADIELRFHHDMLVLSAPLDAALARQGVDVARDRQYLNLMEPDVVRDALRMELVAGAQCLVTPTEDVTRARLAHVNMDADAARLARAALDIAAELKPQHVLAEIGPCGLPLDPSSQASLNENRGQYADAARAFGEGAFDALFLNGFTNIVDLKCALMGVAQVSGKPVFASATPNEKASWPELVETMADLGASVVGIETAEPVDRALAYIEEAKRLADLPILVQLRVTQPSAAAAKGLVPLQDIEEYTPDTLDRAAVKLFGAGAQFLRATGAATSACTAALAATVSGLSVRR